MERVWGKRGMVAWRLCTTCNGGRAHYFPGTKRCKEVGVTFAFWLALHRRCSKCFGQGMLFVIIFFFFWGGGLSLSPSRFSLHLSLSLSLSTLSLSLFLFFSLSLSLILEPFGHSFSNLMKLRRGGAARESCIRKPGESVLVLPTQARRLPLSK